MTKSWCFSQEGCNKATYPCRKVCWSDIMIISTRWPRILSRSYPLWCLQKVKWTLLGLETSGWPRKGYHFGRLPEMEELRMMKLHWWCGRVSCQWWNQSKSDLVWSWIGFCGVDPGSNPSSCHGWCKSHHYSYKTYKSVELDGATIYISWSLVSWLWLKWQSMWL